MQKNKKKAAAAGTILALVGGGAAYAYWTTQGEGTGSASTSAGAANLVVTETSTITNMFPGDTAQRIAGTVKNEAANSAYVGQVVVSISSITKGENAPAGTCSASDYTLANPTMNVGEDLASGATEPFGGATIKFNNKANANQDACKGATVHLAYAAS